MKDIDFYAEYQKYKEQNANNANSFEEWKGEHYSVLMNGDQQELFSIIDLLSNNKWLEKYDNNFEAAFYAWRGSSECPILRGTRVFYFCYITKEVMSIYDKLRGLQAA